MSGAFGPFRKQPEAGNKPESIEGYLSVGAYALSLFAIYYGVLTYKFGKDLWHPDGSALNVPYAPQSWGSAMVIFGVLTIIVSSRRLKWSRYVSWSMKTLCLVWGIFAITFIIDIRQGASPAAYPPLGCHLLLAILCANRAILEDQWRT